MTAAHAHAHAHAPAQGCSHEWEQCLTPPDSARPWFRCAHCRVFAYRKKRGRDGWLYISYVCQRLRCRKPAIDRLPGRGSRACYLWRCKECLDAEADPDG